MRRQLSQYFSDGFRLSLSIVSISMFNLEKRFDHSELEFLLNVSMNSLPRNNLKQMKISKDISFALSDECVAFDQQNAPCILKFGFSLYFKQALILSIYDVAFGIKDQEVPEEVKDDQLRITKRAQYHLYKAHHAVSLPDNFDWITYPDISCDTLLCCFINRVWMAP